MPENSTASSSTSVGWGTEYDVQERTIDAQTDTLTIAGQPVYRPYEMVVLAANEMGEAASRPRPVVGYSSEAGMIRHIVSLCPTHKHPAFCWLQLCHTLTDFQNLYEIIHPKVQTKLATFVLLATYFTVYKLNINGSTII